MARRGERPTAKQLIQEGLEHHFSELREAAIQEERSEQYERVMRMAENNAEENVQPNGNSRMGSKQ